MRRLLLLCALLAAGVSVAEDEAVNDWGFHGHRQINHLAVFTLPTDMFGYYKRHIDFITAHAVDPDKRRYAVKGEAERHFIDIDHYCHQADPSSEEPCNPFGFMPRKWDEAVAQYSEDTLRAYGIVPWHLHQMVQRLSKAFRESNAARVLRLSAELGHYVGDACVPLHTTENYNGQMTNQKGIHGFWESRLPELYDTRYDLFTGRATYVDNTLDFAWQRVEESHAAVDSVLRFERELSAQWPEDQKYGYEERGVTLVRTYSEPYSQAYHALLNGQVERRMKTAIVSLGSLWYTAWVDAGQPNLDILDQPELLPALENEISNELNQQPPSDLESRPHE